MDEELELDSKANSPGGGDVDEDLDMDEGSGEEDEEEGDPDTGLSPISEQRLVLSLSGGLPGSSYAHSQDDGPTDLTTHKRSHFSGKPLSLRRGRGRPKKDRPWKDRPSRKKSLGLKLKRWKSSIYVRGLVKKPLAHRKEEARSSGPSLEEGEVLPKSPSSIADEQVPGADSDRGGGVPGESGTDGASVQTERMPAPEEPPLFQEQWPGKVCALCNLGERSQLGQGDLMRLSCPDGFTPHKSSPGDGQLLSPSAETSESSRGGPASVTIRRQKSMAKCRNPPVTSYVEPVDELSVVGFVEEPEVGCIFETSGHFYVHQSCALWSAGVTRSEDLVLENVGPAVLQGSTRRCSHCNHFGATISCTLPSCQRSLHFPCAAASGAFQDCKTVTLVCNVHLDQVPLLLSGEVTCMSCFALGDVSNLMMCTMCGHHYHGSCVGLALLPGVRAGWQCPECRICQVCRQPEEDSKVMLCEACDKAYHPQCLRPIVTTIPKYGWKCKCCRVCSDCGSRTPGAGLSSRWHAHYTVCDSCYQQRNKGFSCPLCRRAYRAAAYRGMVQCGLCRKFVHGTCDAEADLATYQHKKECNPDYEYICPNCKSLTQAGRQMLIKRKDSLDEACMDSSLSASQESLYMGEDTGMEIESSPAEKYREIEESSSRAIGLGKGKPFCASKIAKKKLGLNSIASRPKGMGKGSSGLGKGSGYQKRQRVTDFGRKRGPKSKMRGIFGVPGLGLQRPQADSSATKSEEEPGVENRLVLCSAKDKFVLTQDICVMCGAIGMDQEGCLIACAQCGQSYHPYCVNVKVTKVILQKGWRCLDCTVCEGCGQRNDEGRLILCDDCDISYHIYCMDPPLDYVPRGNWKCKWCATCLSCGSNDPGFNCMWQKSFTECGPCASHSSCPSCLEHYGEGELIIQCVQCERWLHCSCDQIRTEADAERCAEEGYNCVLCRPRDVPPPHLLPPPPPPKPPTPTKSPELPKLHSQAQFFLDGVCLSEMGMHQIKSLTLEQQQQTSRKKRVTKKIPTKADKEAGIMATIESVVAGGSLDNSLDHDGVVKLELEEIKEIKEEPVEVYKEGMIVAPREDGRPPEPPEGFTVYTTESGTMVLRRKRQRNLQKLGIGGFIVRLRGTRYKDKDEEGYEGVSGPGTTPPAAVTTEAGTTTATTPEDKPRRKPQRRKPKSKLMESYPSYLQEAFFGRDLLDTTKEKELGSSSDSDEERASPLQVSEDKTIQLSQDELKAMEEVKAKQDKETDKEDKKVDGSESGSVSIKSPGKDEDEGSDSEVLKDILPLSGDLLDTELVNTIMNEDDDITKSRENLDDIGDDSELNDSLSMTEGGTEVSGTSHKDELADILSPHFNLESMVRDTVLQPGMGLARSQVPGPLPPVQSNLPSPIGFPPPSPYEYSNSPQFSPAFSDSTSPWLPPVDAEGGDGTNSGGSASYNQRSTIKMEADEGLGSGATISAVLYANLNHPEWRKEFPVWTERCKQILKKWRALPSEKKAPYLQQARENRASLRMKKTQQDQDKILQQQKTCREAEQERQWKQLQALRQQQAQQHQQVIQEQRVQAMARVHRQITVEGVPFAADQPVPPLTSQLQVSTSQDPNCLAPLASPSPGSRTPFPMPPIKVSRVVTPQSPGGGPFSHPILPPPHPGRQDIVMPRPSTLSLPRAAPTAIVRQSVPPSEQQFLPRLPQSPFSPQSPHDQFSPSPTTPQNTPQSDPFQRPPSDTPVADPYSQAPHTPRPFLSTHQSPSVTQRSPVYATPPRPPPDAYGPAPGTPRPQFVGTPAQRPASHLIFSTPRPQDPYSQPSTPRPSPVPVDPYLQSATPRPQDPYVQQPTTPRPRTEGEMFPRQKGPDSEVTRHLRDLLQGQQFKRLEQDRMWGPGTQQEGQPVQEPSLHPAIQQQQQQQQQLQQAPQQPTTTQQHLEAPTAPPGSGQSPTSPDATFRQPLPPAMARPRLPIPSNVVVRTGSGVAVRHPMQGMDPRLQGLDPRMRQLLQQRSLAGNGQPYPAHLVHRLAGPRNPLDPYDHLVQRQQQMAFPQESPAAGQGALTPNATVLAQRLVRQATTLADGSHATPLGVSMRLARITPPGHPLDHTTPQRVPVSQPSAPSQMSHPSTAITPASGGAAPTAVQHAQAETQEIPESVTAELEKLEQEGGSMVEVEGVSAILADLGDDDELLEMGNDFNILEYADPELDSVTGGEKTNILDENLDLEEEDSKDEHKGVKKELPVAKDSHPNKPQDRTQSSTGTPSRIKAESKSTTTASTVSEDSASSSSTASTPVPPQSIKKPAETSPPPQPQESTQTPPQVHQTPHPALAQQQSQIGRTSVTASRMPTEGVAVSFPSTFPSVTSGSPGAVSPAVQAGSHLQRIPPGHLQQVQQQQQRVQMRLGAGMAPAGLRDSPARVVSVGPGGQIMQHPAGLPAGRIGLAPPPPPPPYPGPPPPYPGPCQQMPPAGLRGIGVGLPLGPPPPRPPPLAMIPQMAGGLMPGPGPMPPHLQRRSLLLQSPSQEQPLLLEDLLEQEKREQEKQHQQPSPAQPPVPPPPPPPPPLPETPSALLSDVEFERLRADVLGSSTPTGGSPGLGSPPQGVPAQGLLPSPSIATPLRAPFPPRPVSQPPPKMVEWQQGAAPSVESKMAPAGMIVRQQPVPVNQPETAGRVPLFNAPHLPAPPLPPEHITTEQDRQTLLHYEQWLNHQHQVVSAQLKYYETEVNKLRKIRKSLNSKQRQLRKSGNELAEHDALELQRVSAEQAVLQKQLEASRKQVRQHGVLIQEYRNKQQQKQRPPLLMGGTNPQGQQPSPLGPPTSSPVHHPSSPMMSPSPSPLHSPGPLLSHSPGPGSVASMLQHSPGANSGMSPHSLQPSPRMGTPHSQSEESPFSPGGSQELLRSLPSPQQVCPPPPGRLTSPQAHSTPRMTSPQHRTGAAVPVPQGMGRIATSPGAYTAELRPGQQPFTAEQIRIHGMARGFVRSPMGGSIDPQRPRSLPIQGTPAGSVSIMYSPQQTAQGMRPGIVYSNVSAPSPLGSPQSQQQQQQLARQQMLQQQQQGGQQQQQLVHRQLQQQQQQLIQQQQQLIQQQNEGLQQEGVSVLTPRQQLQLAQQRQQQQQQQQLVLQQRQQLLQQQIAQQQQQQQQQQSIGQPQLASQQSIMQQQLTQQQRQQLIQQQLANQQQSQQHLSQQHQQLLQQHQQQQQQMGNQPPNSPMTPRSPMVQQMGSNQPPSSPMPPKSPMVLQMSQQQHGQSHPPSPMPPRSPMVQQLGSSQPPSSPMPSRSPMQQFGQPPSSPMPGRHSSTAGSSPANPDRPRSVEYPGTPRTPHTPHTPYTPQAHGDQDHSVNNAGGGGGGGGNPNNPLNPIPLPQLFGRFGYFKLGLRGGSPMWSMGGGYGRGTRHTSSGSSNKDSSLSADAGKQSSSTSKPTRASAISSGKVASLVCADYNDFDDENSHTPPLTPSPDTLVRIERPPSSLSRPNVLTLKTNTERITVFEKPEEIEVVKQKQELEGLKSSSVRSNLDVLLPQEAIAPVGGADCGGDLVIDALADPITQVVEECIVTSTDIVNLPVVIAEGCDLEGKAKSEDDQIESKGDEEHAELIMDIEVRKDSESDSLGNINQMVECVEAGVADILRNKPLERDPVLEDHIIGGQSKPQGMRIDIVRSLGQVRDEKIVAITDTPESPDQEEMNVDPSPEPYLPTPDTVKDEEEEAVLHDDAEELIVEMLQKTPELEGEIGHDLNTYLMEVKSEGILGDEGFDMHTSSKSSEREGTRCMPEKTSPVLESVLEAVSSSSETVHGPTRDAPKLVLPFGMPPVTQLPPSSVHQANIGIPGVTRPAVTYPTFPRIPPLAASYSRGPSLSALLDATSQEMTVLNSVIAPRPQIASGVSTTMSLIESAIVSSIVAPSIKPQTQHTIGCGASNEKSTVSQSPALNIPHSLSPTRSLLVSTSEQPVSTLMMTLPAVSTLPLHSTQSQQLQQTVSNISTSSVINSAIASTLPLSSSRSQMSGGILTTLSVINSGSGTPVSNTITRSLGARNISTTMSLINTAIASTATLPGTPGTRSQLTSASVANLVADAVNAARLPYPPASLSQPIALGTCTSSNTTALPQAAVSVIASVPRVIPALTSTEAVSNQMSAALSQTPRMSIPLPTSHVQPVINFQQGSQQPNVVKSELEPVIMSQARVMEELVAEGSLRLTPPQLSMEKESGTTDETSTLRPSVLETLSKSTTEAICMSPPESSFKVIQSSVSHESENIIKSIPQTFQDSRPSVFATVEKSMRFQQRFQTQDPEQTVPMDLCESKSNATPPAPPQLSQVIRSIVSKVDSPLHSYVSEISSKTSLHLEPLSVGSMSSVASIQSIIGSSSLSQSSNIAQVTNESQKTEDLRMDTDNEDTRTKISLLPQSSRYLDFSAILQRAKVSESSQGLARVQEPVTQSPVDVCDTAKIPSSLASLLEQLPVERSVPSSHMDAGHKIRTSGGNGPTLAQQLTTLSLPGRNLGQSMLESRLTLMTARPNVPTVTYMMTITQEAPVTTTSTVSSPLTAPSASPLAGMPSVVMSTGVSPNSTPNRNSDMPLNAISRQMTEASYGQQRINVGSQVISGTVNKSSPVIRTLSTPSPVQSSQVTMPISGRVPVTSTVASQSNINVIMSQGLSTVNTSPVQHMSLPYSTSSTSGIPQSAINAANSVLAQAQQSVPLSLSTSSSPSQVSSIPNTISPSQVQTTSSLSFTFGGYSKSTPTVVMSSVGGQSASSLKPHHVSTTVPLRYPVEPTATGSSMHATSQVLTSSAYQESQTGLTGGGSVFGSERKLETSQIKQEDLSKSCHLERLITVKKEVPETSSSVGCAVQQQLLNQAVMSTSSAVISSQMSIVPKLEIPSTTSSCKFATAHSGLAHRLEDSQNVLLKQLLQNTGCAQQSPSSTPSQTTPGVGSVTPTVSTHHHGAPSLPVVPSLEAQLARPVPPTPSSLLPPLLSNDNPQSQVTKQQALSRPQSQQLAQRETPFATRPSQQPVVQALTHSQQQQQMHQQLQQQLQQQQLQQQQEQRQLQHQQEQRQLQHQQEQRQLQHQQEQRQLQQHQEQRHLQHQQEQRQLQHQQEQRQLQQQQEQRQLQQQQEQRQLQQQEQQQSQQHLHMPQQQGSVMVERRIVTPNRTPSREELLSPPTPTTPRSFGSGADSSLHTPSPLTSPQAVVKREVPPPLASPIHPMPASEVKKEVIEDSSPLQPGGERKDFIGKVEAKEEMTEMEADKILQDQAALADMKKLKRRQYQQKRRQSQGKEPATTPKKRQRKGSKVEEDHDSYIENLMSQLRQLTPMNVLEPSLSRNHAVCSIFGAGDLAKIGSSRDYSTRQGDLKGRYGVASLPAVSDHYNTQPFGSLTPLPPQPPISTQRGFYDQEFAALKLENEGDDKKHDGSLTGSRDRDNDTPDTIISSSSPECVIPDLPIRFPGLRLIEEDELEKDEETARWLKRASPIIPLIMPTPIRLRPGIPYSKESNDGDKENIGAPRDHLQLKSRLGMSPPAPLRDSGNVTVTLTLTAAAAEDILGVLRDLANVLHIPAPSAYHIVERTSTPPSQKLGLYRTKGKDGKEGAPIDIQSILNGAAKFCRHCDVVILSNLIRKKASELPFLAKDDLVENGDDLYFCSSTCYMQFALMHRSPSISEDKAAAIVDHLCQAQIPNQPKKENTAESEDDKDNEKDKERDEDKDEEKMETDQDEPDLSKVKIEVKEEPEEVKPLEDMEFSVPSDKESHLGSSATPPRSSSDKKSRRHTCEDPGTPAKVWRGLKYKYWSPGIIQPAVKYKKPTDREITEMLFRMGITMMPPKIPDDIRKCMFCHQIGDGVADGPARLLNFDVDKWVHLNCALWSDDVYETVNGALMNLESALQQSLVLSCVLCHRGGATIRCFKHRCSNVYHLGCAVKDGCVFFKNKSTYCSTHVPKNEKDNELTTLSVFRRVYVNRDENRQVATVMHHTDHNNLLRVGSLIFLSVGQLLPHQLQAFHTPNYIYPIGYKIVRFYWSMRVPNKRCRYVCSIHDVAGRPEFRVLVQEPCQDDLELRDSTPRAVWTRILEPMATLRRDIGGVQVFPRFVSGEDLFGLTEPAVVRVLESLPGVETLTDYRFKYGRNPLLELPLAVNPTGCARTEPKLRSQFPWKRPHTQRTGSSSRPVFVPTATVAGEAACPYSKQFVHSKSSQYKKMKQEWRNNVYLARSKIQGLGLYAARDLERHTMVIEYIGEVIRTELSEMREKQYEARNRGIYMFRLDEERVVDATLSGGLARYINHSCNPNCVAEIVEVERDLRIIIFAKRRITRGEELAYDYKFDIEDDQHKIPCNCGAPNCRKWMN